ncbi:MAG: N-acetyltransferase [Nitrospirae bacterium]|nr:N-acetyltransferase [Nitrospirota bacterium]
MSYPAVYTVYGDQEMRDFLKLPHIIYKGDPNWVPPLTFDVKTTLNRKKNPLFEHAEAEYFVAREGREPVGRIAAIIDHNYNKYHDKKVGWFGFFECVDDPDVARALFRAACGWLKERGMTEVLGPASPTLNDEAGMLLEGYGKPPCIMMAYNPEYYHKLVVGEGFAKVKDLYAWYSSMAIDPPERVERVVKRVKERNNLTIRHINMKDFRAEIGRVKEIYNAAWEKNWDFASMTEAEVDFMAAKLKPVIIPEMVHFIEIDGRAVAVSIIIPDMNRVLIKMGGKLLPFGWLKFLYYRRKIKEGRLFALGILPEYRGKGFDAVLYIEALMRGKEMGMTGAELSWTLEDNDLINKGIMAMGCELYKKYRVYGKGL